MSLVFSLASVSLLAVAALEAIALVYLV